MREQEAGAANPAEFLRDRIFEAVRHDGRSLSMRQLALLLACFTSTKPLAARELSGHLRIPGPATSRAIDYLVAEGFIRRQRHPTDGRSILLFICPEGIKYCETLVGKSVGFTQV